MDSAAAVTARTGTRRDGSSAGSSVRRHGRLSVRFLRFAPSPIGTQMNEDERGITPADSTSMSIQVRDGRWWVIIEQGNGDVIKDVELTEMERVQLAAMLCTEPGRPPTIRHLSFLDYREPVTD